DAGYAGDSHRGAEDDGVDAAHDDGLPGESSGKGADLEVHPAEEPQNPAKHENQAGGYEEWAGITNERGYRGRTGETESLDDRPAGAAGAANGAAAGTGLSCVLLRPNRDDGQPANARHQALTVLVGWLGLGARR